MPSYIAKEVLVENRLNVMKVTTTDNLTGPKGKAGIDCFGQTVCHERKHREQFYEGFTDTSGGGFLTMMQVKIQMVIGFLTPKKMLMGLIKITRYRFGWNYR
jgi:hypothetical protein